MPRPASERGLSRRPPNRADPRQTRRRLTLSGALAPYHLPRRGFPRPHAEAAARTSGSTEGSNPVHAVPDAPPGRVPAAASSRSLLPNPTLRLLRDATRAAAYVASTWTMAPFTRVLVRTSSLFDALYTTSSTRVLRVQTSEPQLKLPVSRRRARCFMLPPRQRTSRVRLGPILVIAIWRPISNFRFMWCLGFLPPVSRRLCCESREMPMTAGKSGLPGTVSCSQSLASQTIHSRRGSRAGSLVLPGQRATAAWTLACGAGRRAWEGGGEHGTGRSE